MCFSLDLPVRPLDLAGALDGLLGIQTDDIGSGLPHRPLAAGFGDALSLVDDANKRLANGG